MIPFKITAVILLAFVFLPHEGFSVIKDEVRGDVELEEFVSQEDIELVKKSD